ncbi:MAG TPA: hypothetical protein VGK77_09670 [Candidatus Binatia bacterium]
MKAIVSSSLLLIALVVLGAAAPVAKTAKPAITMSTHLDKTAMWVGDTLRYTVKAVHDPDVEFVLDQLKKESLNLAPFIVRDISARQGSFGGNKKITEVTLLLTTYESGQVELRIPSFVLYYFRRRPGVEKGDTLAESFPVPATKVGLRSTLTADNLRPRDNRDIWQINPQRWIVPFSLGLAGMVFVLIQLGRRLRASSREEQPLRRRLSRRARQRMLRDFVRRVQGIGRESAEDQLRYYGEVSQFVRGYLSESLEIDASGLTPEEMESALKNRGQNGLSAPVKTVLERCEQVLYNPQGSELGKRWRDEVQGDLGKIADRARG